MDRDLAHLKAGQNALLPGQRRHQRQSRQTHKPTLPRTALSNSCPSQRETRAWTESTKTVHYRDLRSHYNPGQDLLRYVPKQMWDTACHNDPDFKTFTYGDNGTNGRSSALTQLRKGDALLFLARLQECAEGARAGRSGFYLIGGLLVDHAGFLTPTSEGLERFTNNAHAIRGDAQFLGVAGSERSRRFQHAVPVTREICDEVFRDKDGNRWTWNGGKSELARIGSYTRACRRMLDTTDPEQKRRTVTLRDWMEIHTGREDASLLATE